MLCPPALARNVSVFMKWSTKRQASSYVKDLQSLL